MCRFPSSRRDGGHCRRNRVGKSTLVNLLPRLQNPPRGMVFIDGRDVRDIPLHELRGAIGFVPQEPFLFSDTLADNVGFGVPRLKDEHRGRIEAAAGIARLDKDVRDFPQGYNTMVGERGITLSGGQKQRAAIARAVVTDPRILILTMRCRRRHLHEEEILSRLRDVMKAGRPSSLASHFDRARRRPDCGARRGACGGEGKTVRS